MCSSIIRLYTLAVSVRKSVVWCSVLVFEFVVVQFVLWTGIMEHFLLVFACGEQDGGKCCVLGRL